MRRVETAPLKELYELLEGAAGWEAWWPADSGFERAVGAILIQRTRWENVGRAIALLKENCLLTPSALASCPPDRLESLIRPAGFYRQKAAYLKALAEYFSRSDINSIPAARLWKELRELPGVGEETADVLLLYVAGRPRFVVDAYARRILGCMRITANNEELQAMAKAAFGDDLEDYRDCHARIVEHGKGYCNKKACERCAVKKYLA